ncbi:MAG: hypothetical protein AAGE52_38335 [Myxococcota bacterium]
MKRFVLLLLACGTAAPEEVPLAANDEGGEEAFESACLGAPTASPIVLPEVTEADVLHCDDIQPRGGTASRRDRRARESLAAARSAQREHRYLEAVSSFHTARAVAPEDAGVLAELGWAQVLAERWCEEEFDADNYDDEDPTQVACADLGVLTGVETLQRAAERARDPGRRGAIHYNLARAVEAREDVREHLRISLCLRPDNDTVRRAFAARLWSAGLSIWDDRPEALRLMRAATLFDAERRATLDELRQRYERPFALEAIPSDPEDVYPTVEALCRARLGEDQPSLCEVGEWFEDEGWALGSLALPDTELESGRLHLLLARTARGVQVVAELGNEISGDRLSHAYVEEPDIGFLDVGGVLLADVSWQRGQADANGCDWALNAWMEMLVCANDDAGPRCFASGNLGPVPYSSGDLLPTVDDSLGRCEHARVDDEPFDPAPSFNVSLGEDEIVIEREHDGAMWCLPSRETLCGFPGAPSGC